MGNIPGKAKTAWVQDYRTPDTAPNHPGKDGGSVTNPVGNCHRCGQQVKHEEHDKHNRLYHLLDR